MRKIIIAIHKYVIDHRDHFPDSIDQVRPYLGDEKLQRDILTHPGTGLYPGFVYVKPAGTASEIWNLSTMPIMLYEASVKNGYDRNGFIGYADGRVIKNGS